MTSDQGHGIDIVEDDIQSALGKTRLLRLALDVLDADLPYTPATDPARETLATLREWIRTAELKSLRTAGLPRQYAIISPINPLTPPGPDDMKRIASAIRTLDDLGLIVRPDE